jgi:hypothetical protein
MDVSDVVGSLYESVTAAAAFVEISHPGADVCDADEYACVAPAGR